MIQIDVGSLRSPTGVYFSTRKGLEAFNQEWYRGHQPSVCWNLQQLSAGKINVAAAAFFLALANRMRSVSGRRQKILLEWHPKQFTFLSDIGFFDTAEKYDLFEWPYEIGGFESGIINPNTRIMSFDKLLETPNYNNIEEVAYWKKIHREKYRANIINKCEPLFTSTDFSNNMRKLPLILSRTCAELVTNSLLWGNSSAFVGFQRTRSHIFISINDIGKGFRYSLHIKNVLSNYKDYIDIDSDIHAIAIGCMLNENELGLKRAISTILDLNGDITISSNTGEAHWGKELWQSFKNNFEAENTSEAIVQLTNSELNSKPDDMKQAYKHGFTRKWPSSVRGTRIAFSIPVGAPVQ